MEKNLKPAQELHAIISGKASESSVQKFMEANNGRVDM
jgi:hypothetical protein